MPTTVTSPSGRATCTASCIVASAPTTSSTTSAPRPPVASRISAAASSPAVDRDGRAAGRRQLQRRRALVDGDDAGRCHRREQLDRHVTEAADADDDGARPGKELRQRAADGVVRRQAGVGQRSRLRRVEVAERDDEAGRRHEHQRRHAAVEPESAARRAQFGLVDAVVLQALAAPDAVPATPRPVHGDGLADLEAGDPGAERLDPAGVLVAERERRVVGHQAGRELVEQVEVGVAHPGPADPHDDLAGTRLRLRDLTELGVVLPVGQLQGTHPAIQVDRSGQLAPRRGVAPTLRLRPDSGRPCDQCPDQEPDVRGRRSRRRSGRGARA